nr:unnamed protein product [Callosobruchus chinensis]
MGLKGTRTIRENRVEKECPLSRSTEIKKRERCNRICIRCNNCFKSYQNTAYTACQKILSERKKIIDVPQLHAIKKYNENMGGVDRADQNISLYRSQIRGKKWYLPLVAHCVDMAEQNACQLYRWGGGKKDHLRFRQSVATSILETYEKNTRRGPHNSCPSANLYETSRYDRLVHLVVYQEKQTRCNVCHQNCNFFCQKCSVTSHCNAELDAVNGKAMQIESENKKLNRKFQTLESRLKKYNLVIYGLSDQEENTEGAVRSLIRNKRKIEFKPEDLRDCYRIGKKLVKPKYAKRKLLHKHLVSAREKGNSAYIKENTLYVNGDKYTYKGLMNEESSREIDCEEKTTVKDIPASTTLEISGINSNTEESKKNTPQRGENRTISTSPDKYKIIAKHQYGFQKNRSANDAIAALTFKIYSAMDSTKPAIGIFVDLAKAFDTEVAEKSFEKIVRFLESKKLTINWTKTCYLPFIPYNRNGPQYSYFSVSRSKIESQRKTKYMGVVIDSHLRWSEQVTAIVKKLRCQISKFKFLIATSDGRNRSQLLSKN